jgi:hypothetical protein
MTSHEATSIVVRDFIKFQSLHSCLNCMNFVERLNKCEKFNATPPAETIVFSCGADWEDDIPF